MTKTIWLLLYVVLSVAAWAQVSPLEAETLSSTRLLTVTRLSAERRDHASDGLVFCFLVSRTPAAQYQFGIKETKDVLMDGTSYRELTAAALGRALVSTMAVHDAGKYANEHPEIATAISSAAPRSLVVTLTLEGARPDTGTDINVALHVGFGRSPEAVETERLVFAVKVPPDEET